MEQYTELLEQVDAEIADLEAKTRLYRGPIDVIRKQLKGRVRAADSEYDGGPVASQGRLDVVNGKVRTLAPLPGASLTMISAWRGHVEVLRVLLALRADPNATSHDGSTALFMAAGTGRADIVTTLLEAGAEPGLVKTGGFSPLWNAVTQREHLGSRTPWPAGALTESRSDNRLFVKGRLYEEDIVNSEVGVRPHPQGDTEPDAMVAVAELLRHGQRKVDAAREHRNNVAASMVNDLTVFTEASGDLEQRRAKEAGLRALCESLKTELEELKATALADEEGSDDDEAAQDREAQMVENKQSARRRLRTAVTATKLSTNAARGRRRGRSPDPGEHERRNAPKKTRAEIRNRWKTSAVLGSEFSKRSRSPDPMDRSDAMWTAAAMASGERHFRVWVCDACGKRRIPSDADACPLCGKQKPAGPEPCNDYDDWVKQMDEDSGLQYWMNLKGKDSQWDPPPGWEDEFYRRTSQVKPKSREGRALAKLEAKKTAAVGEKDGLAVPRPQTAAEDMARLGAIFATIDADGSGSVSTEELAEALKNDSALAKMLGLRAEAPTGAVHHHSESEESVEAGSIPMEMSIKLLFEAMDRNNDGSVSREEFLGFVASGQAKKAAGGGLGWQILRKKLPWVTETEKLLEEWVDVVDKDGNGLVGKNEAKSMLRALAEFRGFYAAALLEDAGKVRQGKREKGMLVEKKAEDPKKKAGDGSPEPEPDPEPEGDGEDEPEPEPEPEPKAKQKQPEKTGPSNRLFQSMGATMDERRQRKAMLQAMFRKADANGDGTLTRAELIKSLRSNKDLGSVLGLPAKIGDQERAAFERVFQAMDRDDDRAIDEREFVRFFSTGKAAAAAFKLGAEQKERGDGEDIPDGLGEWEWEDLLEELDENNDGQLSAQELMGLFVDIDPKNFTLYTACVLKPLLELKNNGWFDPVTLTKLCAKRVAQAEATLLKSQMMMGKSELHCSEATQQLQRAAGRLSHADRGVATALHYLGNYLNFPVRGTGVTALHIAADRGDMELLEQLLRSDALQVDCQKRNGHTPLHCAAARGHLQAVEALLQVGASLEAVDNAGRTPLQLTNTSRTRMSCTCPKECLNCSLGHVAATLVGTALQRSLADAPPEA